MSTVITVSITIMNPFAICFLFFTSSFALVERWSASKSPASSWKGLSVSDSGKYVTAVGSAVYQSDDYGQSWSELTVPSGKYDWKAVASDDSGSKLVLLSRDDGMFLSSDYGISWSSAVVSSNATWTAICSSSSGQYLMATSHSEANHEGSIFVSKDNGNSWNLAFSGAFHFTSIAVSRDGKNAIAITKYGKGSRGVSQYLT